MKKAILHIGAHKTGSTSIQYSLFCSSKLLLNQHILYPLNFTSERMNLFGQHTLAWRLLNRNIDYMGGIESDVDHISELHALIENSSSNLILSSEEFSKLDCDAIHKLSSVLSQYDVYVILYVRRQDQTASALYQTNVVHYGETRFFNQWIDDMVDCFDYWAIAERWSNKFPGRVVVRPYTRDKLTNGDVITDFELVMNKIFQSGVDLIRPSTELNQTIPSNITSMIRYYNTQPIKEEIVPKLRAVGDILALKKIKSSYKLISLAKETELLKYYFEGNLALSKKYLNCLGMWFEDESSEDSNTKLDDDCQLQGSDLLEMLNQTLELFAKTS